MRQVSFTLSTSALKNRKTLSCIFQEEQDKEREKDLNREIQEAWYLTSTKINAKTIKRCTHEIFGKRK